MAMAKQCDACGDLNVSSNSIRLEVHVPKGEPDGDGVVACDVWDIDVCMGCLNERTARAILLDSCNGLTAKQLRGTE